MNISRLAIALPAVVAFGLCPVWLTAGARADEGGKTPLIPRDVLFGNPDKANVQISHDGSKLSWLAEVDGVLNVWVAPVDALDKAKAVTKDDYRGIRSYFWAHTNQHILYVQDKGGDENWHIYSVNLSDDKVMDLTPFDGVQARVQQTSHEHPTEILAALNNRTPELHDIHRIDISTGKSQLVEQNDQGFVGYLTENDFKVHFAVKMLPGGATEVHRRAGDDAWTLFTTIPEEDNITTSPLGLDETRKNLYMVDSRGRNTAALTSVAVESGDSRVLAQDPRADISGALAHPVTNKLLAVHATYDRRGWQILDDSVKGDFAALAKVADGEFNISSQTHDNRKWTVAYELDNGPVQYYLYDRDTKKARYLFSNRDALAKVKLAKMHPVVLDARDGLKLVNYYTLPLAADADGDGKPNKALPMVLLVHGGPWARDNWGYNPLHQWLANRGYAVMSVNYRGSTGFGKTFTNAGNFEWAGKMHDDLIDSVDWAVAKGIADKDRVAIMGGSYGGYATLVGLTFTPTKFTCGVDIVGPSNLKTLLQSIPPYWKPMLDMFTRRVGDFRTPEGEKLLLDRSPLTYTDRICRPLLIGQGANDPRVKQAEADQIVSAMKSKNIPVTYVLYPDEGHGFRRPENSISFWAVTEAFLSQHLGGRFEPMSDDLTGSTMQIPEGAGQIPGLPESVMKTRTGTDPA